MPIHLKEDLILDIVPQHSYGISSVLPFSKNASPIFAQRKPNGKLCLQVDLGKSTVWLRMTAPPTIIELAPCQMQPNTWQGDLSSANSTNLRLITNCSRRTSGQWKCLHSVLIAKLLPTKDLHKVSAELCLRFQASWVSTWTQSSKLTNVFSAWKTLELQPTMLQTLSEHLGSLQEHSPSRIQTDNRNVSFRSQTCWIPMKNDFTRSNLTTSSEKPQISTQT